MVIFHSYVGLPESNDLDDYSYGHLPFITGYKWDYTFYKWGYKYLSISINFKAQVCRNRARAGDSRPSCPGSSDSHRDLRLKSRWKWEN